MKKFLLSCAVVMSMLTTPAFAAHTKLYSPATSNCVPAIVALYWHNPAYAVIFAKAYQRKVERESPTTGAVYTSACWLGVASASLKIPHRKLYTPAESRAILTWFKDRTPPVATGTVIYK